MKSIIELFSIKKADESTSKNIENTEEEREQIRITY